MKNLSISMSRQADGWFVHCIGDINFGGQFATAREAVEAIVEAAGEEEA